MELSLIGFHAAFRQPGLRHLDPAALDQDLVVEQGAFHHLREVGRAVNRLHTAQERFHLVDRADHALGLVGNDAEGMPCIALFLQGHFALQQDGAEWLVDFMSHNGGRETRLELCLEFQPVILLDGLFTLPEILQLHGLPSGLFEENRQKLPRHR